MTLDIWPYLRTNKFFYLYSRCHVLPLLHKLYSINVFLSVFSKKTSLSRLPLIYMNPTFFKIYNYIHIIKNYIITNRNYNSRYRHCKFDCNFRYQYY